MELSRASASKSTAAGASAGGFAVIPSTGTAVIAMPEAGHQGSQQHATRPDHVPEPLAASSRHEAVAVAVPSASFKDLSNSTSSSVPVPHVDYCKTAATSAVGVRTELRREPPPQPSYKEVEVISSTSVEQSSNAYVRTALMVGAAAAVAWVVWLGLTDRSAGGHPPGPQGPPGAPRRK